MKLKIEPAAEGVDALCFLCWVGRWVWVVVVVERGGDAWDSRVGVGVVSRFAGGGSGSETVVLILSCSLLVGSAVRERERPERVSSAGGVVVAGFSL